jgi:hypothetical protein
MAVDQAAVPGDTLSGRWQRTWAFYAERWPRCPAGSSDSDGAFPQGYARLPPSLRSVADEAPLREIQVT